MQRMKRTTGAALVTLLLVLILAACAGQAGNPLYVRLADEDPGGLSAMAFGDTNVTNLVTSGNVRAGTYVQAGTLIRAQAATAISVTQGATLTLAGSNQPLDSAGNVSTGAIAAGTAGDLVWLRNQGSNTITISDTGTLVLSGNAALGANDTLLLYFDGTNWVELAQADN